MDKIILFVSIVLIVLAVKAHVLTKTEVKVQIDKPWFDRFWTGNRAPKDNLTEQGLKYRLQSNIYAIAGFFAFGIYVVFRS